MLTGAGNLIDGNTLELRKPAGIRFSGNPYDCEVPSLGQNFLLGVLEDEIPGGSSAQGCEAVPANQKSSVVTDEGRMPFSAGRSSNFPSQRHLPRGRDVTVSTPFAFQDPFRHQVRRARETRDDQTRFSETPHRSSATQDKGPAVCNNDGVRRSTRDLRRRKHLLVFRKDALAGSVAIVVFPELAVRVEAPAEHLAVVRKSKSVGLTGRYGLEWVDTSDFFRRQLIRRQFLLTPSLRHSRDGTETKAAVDPQSPSVGMALQT